MFHPVISGPNGITLSETCFFMVRLPRQLMPGTLLWDAWRGGAGNLGDSKECFPALFIINPDADQRTVGMRGCEG